MATLRVMASLARNAASDPGFRRWAKRFSSIEDVNAWVLQHFVYREEREETLREPQFMLADMGRVDNGRIVQLEGDCDDISIFYTAVTKSIGFPSRFVAIRYTPEHPEFEHVFAQAHDGRQWLTLDATTDTTMEPIEEMIQNV